jgi:hypothetical protein
MLFFYWRIYRAAVRTTKAINQGFRTTKGMLRRDRKSVLLFPSRYSRACATTTFLSQSCNSKTLYRFFSLSLVSFHLRFSSLAFNDDEE